MTTKKNLVKSMFMNILTASIFAFGFTACSDEFEKDALLNQEAVPTRSISSNDEICYNINEDASKSTPTFNKDNWRQHNTIYLRVSNTDYADKKITDSEGRTGYSQEVLPWAEGASRQSNLPNNFCKDVTPENGWELVANYCGEYSLPDANYIVLYNKYTGKLCYFYFIPRGVKVNNANDHNWEIMMQDATAEHSVFGYAVPTNRSIKDGSLIKAKNGNYWSQFVTPWTATADALGHQIPNVGWYAFDVDLSVYRKGSTMQADEYIKPTLRGYSEENVNLYGKLNADITGNIDMKKCCVNNMSGAFGPFEDLLGQVKDVKDFFDNAKNLYSDIASGNILGAIEGGIGLAKQGCDLVGIDYGGGKGGFDGYKGEVNLKMQGTIDFLGKISKSTAIEGTSSIEQHLSKYNFEGNHMGEGIWNISDAPVVYYTDAYVDWKMDHKYYATHLDVKSPFGGRVYSNNEDEEYLNEKPHQGRICYFDPTSINLELNPNIFTADEIKNAKVFATCGVRKGVKFGSTDAFRAAQGLTASTVKQDLTSIYWNRLTNGAPYDAMMGYNVADKTGMKAGTKFETEKVNGKWYGMIGRGDANYLLEPLAMHGDKNEDLVPPYEVTVTVIVEHDGKQIVYSRNYLPEYKLMKVENMPDYNPSKFLYNRPDNYMPSAFLQQAVRLHELKKWLYRTLQPTDGTKLVYYDWFPFSVPQKQGHGALFDGNNTTPWHLLDDHKTDQHGHETFNFGVYDNKRYTWWTEFQTCYPVKPSSYTMVTGRHGSEAPKEWALMGKLREGDKWILLDYRNGNDLPNKSTASKEINFNRLTPSAVGGVGYKYFRLEIYSVRDNDEMSLCEFWFNYNN